ncbi:MAG TPA: TetR/AcrR family transcriptional regulator [Candidatus Solibacter sp.]|nr:TetR/AcrR family transcriptional regulator [Candidatus Solibacter sp.]
MAEEAARQFAQKGYHGTSIGALAEALGLHKSSVYTHIEGKEHLLAQIALAGSRSFHDGLDALPLSAGPSEKLRLALRSHLRTVADQIGVAVIWLHEWRHLSGEAREEFLTQRRSYEHRIRGLFEEAVRAGDLAPDLDVKRATLIYLSVANWAYTWLRPEDRIDSTADSLWESLVVSWRSPS